ncbi:MAG: hypothetical protein GVY12_05575 [Bacteroidetes bacterium]|jgi:hypothetical protein|nr:hypothetical protein [Bacteroidota bacterium]
MTFKTFNTHYHTVAIATILMLSAACFSLGQEVQAQNPTRPTEHRLEVKQIDQEWRVVLEGDERQSDITVRRGDRVRWVVQGSDASFQFLETTLFGDGSRVIRDGRPLVLTIRTEAADGIYPYAVFIHEDLEYARGQSPPRIIIDSR